MEKLFINNSEKEYRLKQAARNYEEADNEVIGRRQDGIN